MTNAELETFPSENEHPEVLDQVADSFRSFGLTFNEGKIGRINFIRWHSKDGELSLHIYQKEEDPKKIERMTLSEIRTNETGNEFMHPKHDISDIDEARAVPFNKARTIDIIVRTGKASAKITIDPFRGLDGIRIPFEEGK